MFFRTIFVFFLCYHKFALCVDKTNDIDETAILSKPSYFLIETQDVLAASLFFNNLEQTSLSKKNQEFGINTGEREKIYKYYDFSDYKLLIQEKELSLVVENNLPTYKNNRNVIRYIDNTNIPDKIKTYRAQSYKRRTTDSDKHELIGLIKRKKREQLLKTLSLYNVNELIQVIEVKSKEKVFLINHFGKPAAEITFQNLQIDNYGIIKTYYVLKFEYIHNSATLSNNDFFQLKKIMDEIKAAFKVSFPSIEEQTWIGYAFYTNLVRAQLPIKAWIDNHPLLFKMSQAFFLSLFFFLILYLSLNYYKKNKHINIISKTHRDL